MFNIVMLGPPGCGKGTQSEFIVKNYDLLHVSTGDILRELIDHKQAIGDIINSIISTGNLVPDGMMLEIFEDFIMNHISHYDSFLFDGFPRTIVQAEALDVFLEHHNLKVDIAIYLDVPEEILIKRIKYRATVAGRSDDTEEIIRHRLHIYKTLTEPVIEYYRKSNKLNVLNGNLDLDVVQKQLKNLIDSKQ